MNELELAKALFEEYSEARNSVRDDYCMFWEHLDSTVKQAWLIMAKSILARQSIVTVRDGL